MLKKDIVQQLHEEQLGGYLGEENTQKQLKDRFYWPVTGPINMIGAEQARFEHKEKAYTKATATATGN